MLFTGVLTLVAVLQYLAMLRQSRHMRDGLAETKTTSEAARVSAGIAAAALEQADRPWLKVTPTIRLLSMQEGDASFGLDLRIENVGHSAAQYVRVVAGVIPWKPALNQAAEEHRIINDAKLQTTRQDVVLPTDSVSRYVIVSVNWDELEATRLAMNDESGEIELVLLGAVR